MPSGVQQAPSGSMVGTTQSRAENCDGDRTTQRFSGTNLVSTVSLLLLLPRFFFSGHPCPHPPRPQSRPLTTSPPTTDSTERTHPNLNPMEELARDSLPPSWAPSNRLSPSAHSPAAAAGSGAASLTGHRPSTCHNRVGLAAALGTLLLRSLAIDVHKSDTLSTIAAASSSTTPPPMTSPLIIPRTVRPLPLPLLPQYRRHVHR